MGLFRKKESERAITDRDARSPQTGIKYKDLRIVQDLMLDGADLTTQRHVAYYVSLPDESTARYAAEHIRLRGFTVRIGTPEGPGRNRWPLRCDRHGVVLDVDTVRSNADYFDALAVWYQGWFDGWESSYR